MTKIEFLQFLKLELEQLSDGEVNISVTDISINTSYSGAIPLPVSEMVSFVASIPGCEVHRVIAHAMDMQSPVQAKFRISYVFVNPVNALLSQTIARPYQFADIDMMFDSRHTLAFIVAKAAAHGIVGFTEL